MIVHRFPGFIAILLLALQVQTAAAATAAEIDTRAESALERLYATAPEARSLVQRSTGVLIFPRVLKVGVGIGGEYGEGVLRVDGQPVQYYSTAGGSFGFQLGAQARSQFLLFMTPEALADFRRTDGWEVGVDGSVSLVRIGTGGSIDSNTVRAPVVGFVLADRGLMFDLSLAGTKISPIQRDRAE